MANAIQLRTANNYKIPNKNAKCIHCLLIKSNSMYNIAFPKCAIQNDCYRHCTYCSVVWVSLKAENVDSPKNVNCQGVFIRFSGNYSENLRIFARKFLWRIDRFLLLAIRRVSDILRKCATIRLCWNAGWFTYKPSISYLLRLRCVLKLNANKVKTRKNDRNQQ